MPRLNSEEDDDAGSRRTKTVPFDLAAMMTAPAAATLTVLSGLSEGRSYSVNGEQSWIGRAPDCQITLKDNGVSRRHASVTRVGHTLVLRDNGAKNGTFVNGRRVQEYELHPGDEIQLGSIVSLVFTNASESAERLAQQRAAREKLLSERMYNDRLESLTNIVSRVAHAMNTPLGVATTANAMISSLITEIGKVEVNPGIEELLTDLRDSTALMSRSLERASRIVRTFTQLSSRQLTDERMNCDIGVILVESIEAAKPDAKNQHVTIQTDWTAEDRFPWVGFPGHLAQVFNNLLQNILRYAYDAEVGGEVDVRLTDTGAGYELQVEDYGRGVPDEIHPRIFEPFVTSGHEHGGTGLGLAIVHNIVTNILKGQITCETEEDKGTRFVIRLPRLVPQVTELPPRP